MTKSANSKRPLPEDCRCGEGHRILVVDDDVTMRLIFRKTLQWAGYDVTEAEDGAQALEVFRRRPEQFDAMVLDLVMPKLNGYETLRRIRLLSPGFPVLVVSGVPPSEAFRSLADRRRLSYLVKPIDPEILVHQLGELLASS